MRYGTLKYAFHRTHFEIKMYIIYIDQICIEVFEKTIKRTEIIDHLFERKFYKTWNRQYKNVPRGFSRV